MANPVGRPKNVKSEDDIMVALVGVHGHFTTAGPVWHRVRIRRNTITYEDAAICGVTSPRNRLLATARGEWGTDCAECYPNGESEHEQEE